MHINRSKHQVLGRKLKSEKGMPGISRHRSLKKRKDTLLQEYKMRHKTNNFLDQRIGERNSEMTDDDRIMARFTAERMRVFNKKAMFNLSDSEVLTHKGQTLIEIERFEDTRSDDEDEDIEKTSGALKGKFVENAHFGGGMLTKNKRDRESLIDELINESKKRKAERQRNKEETLEATEKLDEDWKILGQITTAIGEESPTVQKKLKENDYDVVIRQLKFEPHAQASQRLKTDEEVAKEDKDKLEKLEHERLKQLREIEAQKSVYHRSSDDIDDGFSNLTNSYPAFDDENVDSAVSFSDNESEIDQPNNISQELDIDSEVTSSGNVVECAVNQDNKDSDKTSGEDTSNDSSDEECAMEDLTDLLPTVNDNSKVTCHKNNSKESIEVDDTLVECSKVDNITSSYVDLALPYILDVPANYEAFKDIMEKHNIEQQHLIFERLLKSNHPTLEPVNKKKVLQLAEYIIEYVKEGEVSLSALQNMTVHLNILKEFNKYDCLKKLTQILKMSLEDFDESYSTLSSLKFLLWYVMLFVNSKGIEMLLPINKPAVNFLCKIISECNIMEKSQVITSLLCCYLLLLDAKSSSFVYPDVLNFLENCLTKFSTTALHDNHKNISYTADPPSFEKTHFNEELKLRVPHCSDQNEDNNFDIKVLYLSLNILVEFVKMYRKYPHSKLMFKGIYRIINQIMPNTYPEPIKAGSFELKSLLDVLETTSLNSMTKAAKKPKALRQYEPSIHIVTDGKRSLKGLPVEKQEEQKLIHKYKTEMKGALRELRRDRMFLANVKLKEKALSDAERIKKVKEIFGSAAAQQGELRSLKRKK